MKAKALYAVKEDVVELREFDIDDGALGANQLLVKTAYTVISPGTELDCLSGKERSWFHFPQQLGYTAVGEVMVAGDEASDYSPGDMVLAAISHASHGVVDADWTRGKVPAGCEPRDAVWALIASISIVGLRASSAELGDTAVVLGQGLIGNFAAQLLRAQGARVIAVDRLPARLEVAKKCGIEHVVDASSQDAVEAVTDLTGGVGAEVVVEATGSAAAALQAIDMAARNGEMILLGTPRGSHEADVTPLLRAVHRASPNLTIKGAHGGSLPSVPTPFVKHSTQRNVAILLDMIEQGDLHLEPLITRMARPDEAAAVYAELRDHPERALGVMFDWRADAG